MRSGKATMLYTRMDASQRMDLLHILVKKNPLSKSICGIIDELILVVHGAIFTILEIMCIVDNQFVQTTPAELWECVQRRVNMILLLPTILQE